jgi:FtsH-binding integral membrane protein
LNRIRIAEDIIPYTYPYRKRMGHLILEFKKQQEVIMQSISVKGTQTQVLVNEFIRSVYNWMAIGLGLTGFTAYYVSNSESLMRLIFGNQLLFFGLIIGEQ